MPTQAERRLPEIAPPAGALAIDRLGHADGKPVDLRHTLIRGDRFCLLAEFSPRTGFQLNLDKVYPAATVWARAPSGSRSGSRKGLR